MEVHHHAHGHAKKSWRSYFYEFLMLFLAVFCGFMAEYQLEHKIENDREKQYIKSMVKDLEADTSNLRLSIESFNGQERHFDTIFKLFGKLSTGYSASLHKSIKAVIGYRDFFRTDNTMQQLKNAGNMRLIRNREVADSITTYDAKIRRFDNGMKVLDEEFRKMYDQTKAILNDVELESDQQNLSQEQLEKGGKNYLLLSDKPTLGKYYNQVKSYRRLREITLMRMKELLGNAGELIGLLKKEYHLD